LGKKRLDLNALVDALIAMGEEELALSSFEI
jgi:hypothetical protein